MTTTLRRISTALALLAGLLAPHAQGQRPHRAGLWIETGGGVGYVRIASSGSTTVTSAPGSVSYLRFGVLLSDKVLLGVENFGFVDDMLGFFRGDTSSVAETWSFTVVVLWYPWRSSGLFAKAGVGASQGTLTVTPPGGGSPVTATGTGVGLTFGLGYDRKISRKLALTGCLCADIAGIGDVVLPTTRIDDMIASIYHVTIGLTIR
ncbi:MAG TPA: hypothetical protein VGQ18_09510 [Gemmatimonadales bacterium]|jgi:hypothetical protein|nr:hypothetical protein [Gemmatimonadales bacterium]